MDTIQKLKKINEIKTKYLNISSALNERSRRLWAANEAISIGQNGMTIVFKATRIAKTTLIRGMKELKSDTQLSDGKVRRAGAGRKKLENLDKNLKNALRSLVNPETRGDPESPLLWTTKSTRNLSKALKDKGFMISHQKVAQLLKQDNYSLQGLRKINEGKSHPDRDAQFNYINNQAQVFLSENLPVISIDAKKKELVGDFKNGGVEYQPKGLAEAVNAYDFISLVKGKITPYGIYDIANNKGWVSVGVSRDTAQFAVSSIRSWWNEMGKQMYPNSKKILIHADGGGSNGSRNRLWKKELQKFATDEDLEITVSHFPPATSKWNKIEHRLFSQITKNWRGRKLESFEVIVNLIGSTTTESGLTVRAELNTDKFEVGIKVSDEEMEMLNIRKHDFHGNDWNYTISGL